MSNSPIKRNAIALPASAINEISVDTDIEEYFDICVTSLDGLAGRLAPSAYELGITGVELVRSSNVSFVDATVLIAICDHRLDSQRIETLRSSGITILICGDAKAVPAGCVDMTGYRSEDLVKAIVRSSSGLGTAMNIKDVVQSHRAACKWPLETGIGDRSLATVRESGRSLIERFRPAGVVLFGYPTYTLRGSSPMSDGARPGPVPEFILQYQRWAQAWSADLVDGRCATFRHPWEQIDEALHGVKLGADRFLPEGPSWPCAQCVPVKMGLVSAGHSLHTDVNPHCAGCTATRLKLRTVFTAFQDYDLLVILDNAQAARDALLIEWATILPGLAPYDRDLDRLLAERSPLGDIFFYERSQFLEDLAIYEPALDPSLVIRAENCWLPPARSTIDLEAALPCSALTLFAQSDVALALETVRSKLSRSDTAEQTIGRLAARGSYLHDLYGDPQVRNISVERMRDWARCIPQERGQ